MPKYDLACEACGFRRSKILSLPLRKYTAEEQANVRRCANNCATPMRVEINPSSHVVETLDNGSMSRRVERLADAERLYKDRAASDPRNK